jgi:hypothetical protein
MESVEEGSYNRREGVCEVGRLQTYRMREVRDSGRVVGA